MSPARPAAGRRRVAAWSCALVWGAAFVVSHLPPGGVAGVGRWDKLLHAAGYAVIAGVFAWAIASPAGGRAGRLALAILVPLAYATVDELTQPLVGRSAEWGDWLADAAGTMLGVAAVGLIGRSRPRPPRSP
jgi:VanZ family protein